MHTPRLGTVFGVHDDLFDRWSLVQLTYSDDDSWGWLTLDWFERRTPDEAEVARLAPLSRVSYSWAGHEDYTAGPPRVPRDWVEVGHRPPLRTEAPRSGWAGQTPRPAMRTEYEWRLLSDAQRALYREQPSGSVSIGGVEMPADVGRLSGASLAAPVAEIARLVAVTDVFFDDWCPDPQAVLEALPRVGTVHLQTPLSPFRLPHTVHTVVIGGAVTSDDLGWFDPPQRVHTHARAIVRMLRTEALAIVGVSDLDLAEVADHAPAVRDLRLWGPGHIRSIDALAALPRLRGLLMVDVFGWDRLPPALPLDWMQLSSIPSAAAKAAKVDYAEIAPRVTQPRTDAWLAANVDHPFRHWDGSAHVPAAAAQQATATWRGLRKEWLARARTVAKGGAEFGELHAAVRQSLGEVAEEFNALDSGWIETAERDDIAEAYLTSVREAFAVAQAPTPDAAVDADLWGPFEASRDW